MGQSKSKMLSPDAISVKKKGFLYYLKRDWQLYALMLLPMAFIIVFKYFAYTGLSVAFLDYKIGKGYAGSKFVGLKVFEKVFKHRDFGKAVANTLLLNVLDLLFSFPMPIILALLLNEIRVKWFKRVTQTLLYLPHFLSWVVIGATAYAMFATNSGVINTLIANAGKSPIPFLQEDAWWLFSYILIGIWQTMGWGTIIYLAAITNVNSELYEAAKVDGANRWQQCLHVTLPCIRSTSHADHAAGQADGRQLRAYCGPVQRQGDRVYHHHPGTGVQMVPGQQIQRIHRTGPVPVRDRCHSRGRVR